MAKTVPSVASFATKSPALQSFLFTRVLHERLCIFELLLVIEKLFLWSSLTVELPVNVT